MSYVYLRSEPRLWTVGFYAPDGTWTSESDHGDPEELLRALDQSEQETAQLRDQLKAILSEALLR